MEYPKFKVCCRCFTFNQAKYITDAMNGFTMQHTSFPFVCTIVDDASTDGEQEVIRKYLEDNFDFSEGSTAFNKETDYGFLTYAQHKTNKNCYFAVLYLKENHYSKKKSKNPYISKWRDICTYEAMCEGDDYWIDENKLQNQVDVLDSNPEVILVHTGFKNVNEKGEVINRPKYNRFMNISAKEKSLVSLFDKNHIMTLSCVFRKELLSNPLFANSPAFYDYSYFLASAFLGRIKYIPQITCCYRLNPGSVMQTKRDIVNKKLYEVYRYYVLHYLTNEVHQSLMDKIQTLFYICTNILFNRDKGMLHCVLINKPLGYFVLPFSALFSLLKSIKNKC